MTTEDRTFSSVIDEALRTGGRGPSERNRVISYARASIREAGITREFDRDLVELTITATAKPFVWSRPASFRMMKAVRYSSGVHPDFIAPGKKTEGRTNFFYAASTYYAFSGLEINDTIDLAYMNYPSTLMYYASNVRPARFDMETMAWEYLDNSGNYVATLGSDALDEAARDKVTNWLIFDWPHIVLEGSLAKIYKLNKDDRAVSSFALFKSFINDLVIGEAISAYMVT